ncbi:hypothetical protein [Jidongwangia harbinensis]|uniref:hypothetical protein n=1 Tax=Jidongwangia harbinensis TaxID=2878561 RepID=UPI001CDA53AC|nr:hypothetical protein [Jidongwangia harbinensis]MCA2213709.1 hypothetical protein [Jidongwangia harbinensis]
MRETVSGAFGAVGAAAGADVPAGTGRFSVAAPAGPVWVAAAMPSTGGGPATPVARVAPI